MGLLLSAPGRVRRLENFDRQTNSFLARFGLFMEFVDNNKKKKNTSLILEQHLAFL